MQFYDISRFNYDLQQGNPVVEVLRKVYHSKHKNQLVQQIANGNYKNEVKICISNIDFILQNVQQFSGMNWIQVVQIIQGNNLNKNYTELQRDYQQIRYEKEQLKVQVSELNLRVNELEEEKKQYLEKNRDLAQTINEYAAGTLYSIRQSSMQIQQEKGLVEESRSQIRTLEHENEKLRDRIRELEYLIKAEQRKAEKKTIGMTEAEIAMQKGVNDTMNLINQLKGNNTSTLGYNTIPLISNGNIGNSIPMTRSNVAIPMPAPPGMENRSTGPIYSSQININEIPKRSGVTIDEPFTFTIGGPENPFSMIFYFKPDEHFEKIMGTTVLPIYGRIQEENYVNKQIWLNTTNGNRIDLMNYLDEQERYKQIFDQWYRNYVGNNFNSVLEVIDAYKYILYEIEKQGKKDDFNRAINQMITLA